MNGPKTARAIYKKLLALYPREFRDALGESMQQTFNDLYRERQTTHRLFAFLLWMFAETGLGVLREHILLLINGAPMKTILSNPRSAAIVSLVLSLPLGLTYVILTLNIEPLASILNNLFTMDGLQGEIQINMLGRIVILGGLVLLPVALALNLQPLLKKEGRRLYPINIVAGTAILVLVILTWGGLILEQIACFQGIRCD